MTSLSIKIVVGFRGDQSHTISADEAHKAYYLFLHPTERGIFNGGLAIIGSEIRQIVPDYNASMGWNPTYQLTPDDWNEIRSNKVDVKIRSILYAAKEIAQDCQLQELNKPLTSLLEENNKRQLDSGVRSVVG